MNKYLSTKLKVLSFLLMILVVFIHSHNIAVKLLSGNTVLKHGYSSFIQDFISDGICYIAVPLFFCISGYLFFLKFEGSYKEFKSKYTKRFRTLVIPYLIWSIGVLLIFFIIQLLPVTSSLSENKIKDYSTVELLTKIFITPIPLQLWFVRDLILLTILSPVVYWLIRVLNFIPVGILFVAWIFDVDFTVPASVSLLFFVVGAYLSIKKDTLLLTDFSKRYLPFTVLWLALVLCRTILLYLNFENQVVLTILLKSFIVIGLLAAWSLYDFLFYKKDLSKISIYSVFSFSFFIFVFHIPILNVFKRGLFYFLGKEEFASLIIYITAPVITISLGILIGYYLKRYVPSFYGIITGGR